MSTSAPNQTVSDSRARRSKVSHHLLKLPPVEYCQLNCIALDISSDKRHSFFLEQASG
jgi:hypothetical protein